MSIRNHGIFCGLRILWLICEIKWEWNVIAKRYIEVHLDSPRLKTDTSHFIENYLRTTSLHDKRSTADYRLIPVFFIVIRSKSSRAAFMSHTEMEMSSFCRKLPHRLQRMLSIWQMWVTSPAIWPFLLWSIVGIPATGNHPLVVSLLCHRHAAPWLRSPRGIH